MYHRGETRAISLSVEVDVKSTQHQHAEECDRVTSIFLRESIVAPGDTAEIRSERVALNAEGAPAFRWVPLRVQRVLQVREFLDG